MSEHEQKAKGIRRAGSIIGALVAARALREALKRPRSLPPKPQQSHEDPSRREVPSNPRAEAAVALLLLGASVFALGFTAVYILDGLNAQLLGVALGGTLALLAAAAIIAGKAVVPQETAVQERDVLLEEPEVEQVLQIVESGGEGVTRRKLLAGAAGLAGGGLVTAAATPLASLGPAMTGVHSTPWQRGVRLVDDKGNPYSAEEIQIGSFYTALPEHGDPELLGAGLLVVKLPPEYIHLPVARRGWAPQGILAYSKICPHAGCAISLYRYPLYQPTSNGPAFTCPCHYSTFLPGEGGRVVFGPAGRSLPQLPLMIDGKGHLLAAGPFHEDIGPSWWSTHRSES
ncbi:MAG: ubiquinol-cytochrome c reductase iron-sulfur subunit [Solirubrobacterales bacterium]|nr:ubiquinol-cytochrome c reductase iron-sulfur subunit [Solirubrobacterales bacterium]